MNADLLLTIAAIQQQTTSAGILDILSGRRPDNRNIDADDAADLSASEAAGLLCAIMETANRAPALPDLRLAS